jgi:menaquinone-specific isochorismate synthase
VTVLPATKAAANWIRQELAASADDPRLVLLGLPAPVVPPERVFSWRPSEPAVFWEPNHSLARVGLGVAIRLESHGPERFDEVRRQAAGCEFAARAWPGLPNPTLRWFGGFAFAPGQCAREPWIDFGDGLFLLPRFLYERAGARASLVLATTQAERRQADTRASIADAVESLLAALSEPCVSSSAHAPMFGTIRAVELREQDYRERVLDIQRAIAQGSVSKVVAARRLVVDLPNEPGYDAVLDALRCQDSNSIVFAFRVGGSCFVGASPERLVRRSGTEIETEAVAGSAPTLGPGGQGDLLASPKNRWEHQLVVDTLRKRLDPLCASLELGATAVRALSRVLHLWTPIRGRLHEPRHVLELVERLHPSPAVGGVPVQCASEWILRHEPDARGWYSAPLGWFDADGNGDFAVALRSGLFYRKRAYLFAGSGIVERSDAAEEFHETELKLWTLRSALGVEMP